MKLFKILIIFLLFFFLSGCDQTKKEINDKYKVAIIETSSKNENSLITYYNENLEQNKTIKLKYAELGSNFYNPNYSNDVVYLVPRGLQGKHNTHKIIGLDTLTDNIKDYNIERTNILCTATNDKYIFSVSNLNAISYLTRFSKTDDTIKEITYPNEYLSLVAADNEKVFAFVNTIKNDVNHSELKVYNANNLDLLNTIDITEYGINQTKYYLNDNYLFFSNPYDKYDQPNNILAIYNIKDNSISKLTLMENYPDDIIQLDQNRLLISCTNQVQLDGTSIIIYNMLKNEEIKYNLKFPIMDIQVVANKLYVLSSDDTLSVYDINDGFDLIKSVKHNTTNSTYCSSLIKVDDK